MYKPEKLYLYTAECQRLLSNKCKSSQGDLYKKVSKKFLRLSQLSERDNSMAKICYTNISTTLDSYINNLRSEIKKYQLALIKIENHEQILKTTKKKLTRRGYPVQLNNLVFEKLNQLLVLMDELIVLLLTLHSTGQCFESRTMLTVVGRLRKTLNQMLGKINNIPIKNICQHQKKF
jgi:hypothetical protein